LLQPSDALKVSVDRNSQQNEKNENENSEKQIDQFFHDLETQEFVKTDQWLSL